MTNATASPTAPGTGAPASMPDPRPLFARAAALGADVIANVKPSRFDEPTPCDEYDVHALLGHLVAGVRRLAAAGRGLDADTLPLVVDDVGDEDWSAAWAAAVDEVDLVFTDDVLAQTLTLPFAVLPAPIALTLYVAETTVHTWDLATATGQSPAWDDEVTTTADAAMRMGLPGEPRGGEVPFAPVVDIDLGAPAIDRLVAWSGRNPAWTATFDSAA